MNSDNTPGTADAEKLQALVSTGQWLLREGYTFVTPTPLTHSRVVARSPARAATSLRDVFGWSLPFDGALLPPERLAALRAGGLVAGSASSLKSIVRFSTIGPMIFAHSAWPTASADAVFFGPDTYRFVALINDVLALMPLSTPGARILDVGCGAGPGGLAAAHMAAQCSPRLSLADINPQALVFAKANAQLAQVAGVEFAQGDLFGAVDGLFDLIVANPPYLNDSAARLYRHGGGAWGGGLSGRIVTEGLPRLAPGGRLVLYTGAAIIDGKDPLLDNLRPVLDATGWPWTYRELDPDVFGEELEEPAYAGAERIAVVALVVRRPAS